MKITKKTILMLPLLVLSGFVLIIGSSQMEITSIKWFSIITTFIFLNSVYYLLLTKENVFKYRLILFSTLSFLFVFNFVLDYKVILESINSLTTANYKACNSMESVLVIPAVIVNTIIFSGNIWGMTFGLVLIAMIFIGVSLSLGKGFCSWICIIGGLDDVCSNISKKTLIDNHKIERKWTYIPYAFLLVILLLSAILFVPENCNLCPLENFSTQDGINLEINFFAILGILIFVIMTIVMPLITNKRTFCAFVCPVGAVLSIANKISVFKVEIDSNLCNKCLKCVEICPTLSIDKEGLDCFFISDTCSKCYKCIDSCEKKAIKLSSRLVKNYSYKMENIKLFYIYPSILFYTLIAGGLIQGTLYKILQVLFV